MGRALTANVVVLDDAGNPVLLKKGSKVPAEYADQVGDHCFAQESDQEEADAGHAVEPVASSTPPPKSGKGSSTEDWAAYAASLEVAVDAGATRDAIMQAVADAGHPVE